MLMGFLLVVSCHVQAVAADDVALPDTQTPEFSSIVDRYNTAVSAVRDKHKATLTGHIKRYQDEAAEMLKEKRKTRNTTGIAIATAAISIFATALSDLNATGTFEIPQKVRRELESTIAEFNTGRALIDSNAANEQAKVLKQFSDEFAAQCQKLSPALTSPEARVKMDERFQARIKESSAPPQKNVAAGTSAGSPTPPGGSGTNVTTEAAATPTMAESGESPTWITVGTLTAKINSMEVLEIPLAEMRMGTNSIMKNSVMSETTMEIIFVATVTNFANPGIQYRLLRIPKFNDLSIMDWPADSNGYHLNLRTPSPDRIPFPVGFELQVSSLDKPGKKKIPAAKRTITLTVRSTPPRAAIYIDGALQPDTVTPSTLQLPVGPHDFRLTLAGYPDLNVTNYNFTINREINWTFKPAIVRPAAKPRIQP